MIQTIAVAAIAGSLPVVPRTVVVLCAAALAWQLVRSPPHGTVAFDYFETAAELERTSFAPDAANEWLPAQARPVGGPLPSREPTITAGVVDEFDRRPGYLRVHVAPNGFAKVTLPHYYFPVGWQATFAGHPIRLSPSPDGLMTAWVVLPGVLEARFSNTPARRTGLFVSGVTLALLVAGIMLAQRLGRHARSA